MYVPTLQDTVLSAKIFRKSNSSKVQGKESVWTFRDYLSYLELKEFRTGAVGDTFIWHAEIRVSLAKQYSVKVQRKIHEHRVHSSPCTLDLYNFVKPLCTQHCSWEPDINTK